MKIEHIAINVPDPAGNAEWYAEHLGFRILRADTHGARIHFLADSAGDTVLELYANELGDFIEVNHWSFHIAFSVPSIEAQGEKWLAAGCTATSEIITFPNGDKIQFFRDPFGLHLQLVQRITPLAV